MTRRRRRAATKPEGLEEHQREDGVASAFDAAESLLNAALDEVQAASPPEMTDADDTGESVRDKRANASVMEGPNADPPSTEPPPGGADTSGAPLEPADARRRRRQQPVRAAPPHDAGTGDEPTSTPSLMGDADQRSIESLDSEPGDGHRRWRRPPADAAAPDAGFGFPSAASGSRRRWRRSAAQQETQLTLASGDVPPVLGTAVSAADSVDEATSMEPAGLLKSTAPKADDQLPEPASSSGGVPGSVGAVDQAVPAVAAAGGVKRSGRRRAWVVAAALIAVIGAVVALFAGAFGGGSSSTTAQQGGGPTASHPARLRFAAVTTPEGLEVRRQWTLSGEKGTDFSAKLSFSNPTGNTVIATHTEVIPKSLASSVDQIAFDPKPTIVQPDPVVRYYMTVPPHSETTARYDITVPAEGANESRLNAWAHDMRDASQAIADAATTTTVPPTTTVVPPTTTTRPSTTTAPRGTTSPPATTAAPETTSPSPPVTSAPPPTSPPPTTSPPLPAIGTITVCAISYGGTGTFGFTGPAGENLSLTTSGTPDGGACGDTIAVVAGTYAWTETSLSSGWSLFGIDCTDRDAGPFEDRSTVSGATATFNVQPGEAVRCTWSNR